MSVSLGLLGIDASIIEEDETHAVIAVRVPKVWISRNLHFMAALADLVPTQPAGGPPARTPAVFRLDG